MRIAVAALCVLALTGAAEARDLITGRDPCTVKLPKLAETSVRYEVRNLSQREVDRICQADTHPLAPNTHVAACTFPAKDGTWWVYVTNDGLTLDQLGCVVAYEKAHMPPNFWADPKMERPETMDWLRSLAASH